jgi:hypothetical protein
MFGADVVVLQGAVGLGRTTLEVFTMHLWRLLARMATRRRIGSWTGALASAATREP